MKTSLGQAMDLHSSPNSNEKPNLEKFTMEAYNNIVKYKTAYYSFYLPVAIAMCMVNIQLLQIFIAYLLSLMFKNVLRPESAISACSKRPKKSFCQWVVFFKFKMTT